MSRLFFWRLSLSHLLLCILSGLLLAGLLISQMLRLEDLLLLEGLLLLKGLALGILTALHRMDVLVLRSLLWW